MEAVKTQDVGVNDLPWIIEYHPDRCTMCGSCVASCSFKAIKVAVRGQSLTVSEKPVPEPKKIHWVRQSYGFLPRLRYLRKGLPE